MNIIESLNGRVRYLEEFVAHLEERVAALEAQHVPDIEPTGAELIAITEQSPSTIEDDFGGTWPIEYQDGDKQ